MPPRYSFSTGSWTPNWQERCEYAHDWINYALQNLTDKGIMTLPNTTQMDPKDTIGVLQEYLDYAGAFLDEILNTLEEENQIQKEWEKTINTFRAKKRPSAKRWYSHLRNDIQIDEWIQFAENFQKEQALNLNEASYLLNKATKAVQDYPCMTVYPSKSDTFELTESNFELNVPEIQFASVVTKQNSRFETTSERQIPLPTQFNGFTLPMDMDASPAVRQTEKFQPEQEETQNRIRAPFSPRTKFGPLSLALSEVIISNRLNLQLKEASVLDVTPTNEEASLTDVNSMSKNSRMPSPANRMDVTSKSEDTRIPSPESRDMSLEDVTSLSEDTEVLIPKPRDVSLVDVTSSNEDTEVPRPKLSDANLVKVTTSKESSSKTPEPKDISSINVTSRNDDTSESEQKSENQLESEPKLKPKRKSMKKSNPEPNLIKGDTSKKISENASLVSNTNKTSLTSKPEVESASMPTELEPETTQKLNLELEMVQPSVDKALNLELEMVQPAVDGALNLELEMVQPLIDEALNLELEMVQPAVDKKLNLEQEIIQTPIDRTSYLKKKDAESDSGRTFNREQMPTGEIPKSKVNDDRASTSLLFNPKLKEVPSKILNLVKWLSNPWNIQTDSDGIQPEVIPSIEDSPNPEQLSIAGKLKPMQKKIQSLVDDNLDPELEVVQSIDVELNPELLPDVFILMKKEAQSSSIEAYFPELTVDRISFDKMLKPGEELNQTSTDVVHSPALNVPSRFNKVLNTVQYKDQNPGVRLEPEPNEAFSYTSYVLKREQKEASKLHNEMLISKQKGVFPYFAEGLNPEQSEIQVPIKAKVLGTTPYPTEVPNPEQSEIQTLIKAEVLRLEQTDFPNKAQLIESLGISLEQGTDSGSKSKNLLEKGLFDRFNSQRTNYRINFQPKKEVINYGRKLSKLESEETGELIWLFHPQKRKRKRRRHKRRECITNALKFSNEESQLVNQFSESFTEEMHDKGRRQNFAHNMILARETHSNHSEKSAAVIPTLPKSNQPEKEKKTDKLDLATSTEPLANWSEPLPCEVKHGEPVHPLNQEAEFMYLPIKTGASARWEESLVLETRIETKKSNKRPEYEQYPCLWTDQQQNGFETKPPDQPPEHLKLTKQTHFETTSSINRNQKGHFNWDQTNKQKKLMSFETEFNKKINTKQNGIHSSQTGIQNSVHMRSDQSLLQPLILSNEKFTCGELYRRTMNQLFRYFEKIHQDVTIPIHNNDQFQILYAVHPNAWDPGGLVLERKIRSLLQSNTRSQVKTKQFEIDNCWIFIKKNDKSHNKSAFILNFHAIFGKIFIIRLNSLSLRFYSNFYSLTLPSEFRKKWRKIPQKSLTINKELHIKNESIAILKAHLQPQDEAELSMTDKSTKCSISTRVFTNLSQSSTVPTMEKRNPINIWALMNFTRSLSNPVHQTSQHGAEEDSQNSNKESHGNQPDKEDDIQEKRTEVQRNQITLTETKFNQQNNLRRICLFCGSNGHKLMHCQLNPKERTTQILNSGRCARCLQKGHKAANCWAEACRNCGREHHTFLCYRWVSNKNVRLGSSNGIKTNMFHPKCPCLFCGENEHSLKFCPLDNCHRMTMILNHNRCIKCLTEGHQADGCLAEPCRICKGLHHTFLCDKSFQRTKQCLPPISGPKKIQRRPESPGNQNPKSLCSINESKTDCQNGSYSVKPSAALSEDKIKLCPMSLCQIELNQMPSSIEKMKTDSNTECQKEVIPNAGNQVTLNEDLTQTLSEDKVELCSILLYNIGLNPMPPSISETKSNLSNKENDGDSSIKNLPRDSPEDQLISHMRSDPPIFLMTNRVKIAEKEETTAFSVYDTGCGVSFVKQEFVDSIGAQILGEEIIFVNHFGNQSPKRLKTSKYLLRLLRTDGEAEEIEAFSIDHIGSKCPSATTNGSKWNPKAKVLGSEEEPDILIGVIDFLRIFRNKEEITHDSYVVQTTLGDVLCGRWEVDSWIHQNVYGINGWSSTKYGRPSS